MPFGCFWTWLGPRRPGRPCQSCHWGQTTRSGNCQPNVRPNHASASHTVRIGRCCTCQTRGRLGNLGHLEGVLVRSRLRLSGHAVFRDEVVDQWPAINASRSSDSFSVGVIRFVVRIVFVVFYIHRAWLLAMRRLGDWGDCPLTARHQARVFCLASLP